jgi:hypothetical protein
VPPAAEDVLLRDRGRQHNAVGAVAQARQNLSGGLLDDREVDIQLVGCSRYGRRLDVDLGEVTEPVDTLLGLSDFLRRVPGAFQLARFAADDLVSRFGIAGDIDSAHVDAPPRIDEERERDFALVPVEAWYRVDVGESVAIVAEAVADELGRLGQARAGERLAGLDLYQPAYLFLWHQQLARHPHVRHGVLAPLGDADRDVDVLLVGRDRDLRGIDPELDITAVEVVGAQRFQVGG